MSTCRWPRRARRTAMCMRRNSPAGWVVPPANLHHYNLSLQQGVLHSDKDLDPGDCDCHMWMSVNRADTKWVNLAGHDVVTDSHPCSSFCFLSPCDFDDDNTLADWDDDQGCGDGSLNFNGPAYDFYLADNQDVRGAVRRLRLGLFRQLVRPTALPRDTSIGTGTCFITNFDDITQGESNPYPDNDNLRDTGREVQRAERRRKPRHRKRQLHHEGRRLTIALEDHADLATTKACTPNP